MSKKPNLQNGHCRVCHHRGYMHYDGCCHKKLSTGFLCGCVGWKSAAPGDAKRKK